MAAGPHVGPARFFAARRAGRRVVPRPIDKSYGGADNAADWVSLAQFVNYDGYRAMFEAQSKNRMGLLIWMSHPTWPSFVWQTYDYYLEPTAAYFGAKKACEPLHIQWNPATDNVEVVNYSGGHARDLTAAVELINLDGTVKWKQTAAVDSTEDSVSTPIHIQYPDGLSPVHFIRLKLTRADETVSQNFYWRGTEEYNYRALRSLPKVKLDSNTHVERRGEPLGVDHRAAQSRQNAGADGEAEGRAGKERRSHPAGHLQRQLHRADARRALHHPY